MRLIQTTSILFLVLFATMTRPAFSEELREAELRNSVVIVNIVDDRKPVASGSGFVVQSDQRIGYVVTNATLVAGRDSVSITSPVSGEELPAQVMSTESLSNFVLLKVTGLAGRALVLAADQPAANDVVWSAVKWPTEKDTLGLVKGRLLPADEATTSGMLKHTANISDAPGSVVLNDCGQVVGLNVGTDARGAVTSAISVATLKTFLARLNVRTTQASEPCVSVVVQAQQQAALASAEARRATAEAERAQQAAETLEKRLQASTQRNSALEAQATAARSRADEAIAAADVARRNAEETRLELERRTATIKAETAAMLKQMERDQAQAEKRFTDALEQQRIDSAERERLLLIAGGLFLGAAVVVIGLLLRQRGAIGSVPAQAKRAMSEPLGGARGSTELHQQELVEYVLDGRDEDGIRYLLRISGDQLTNPDGVVIGRNPQDSPYIINHADVSRKHARMKVMKNRVFIEDLGSTNGTSVNGQSIDDKGPVSIDNGDQIIIGSVVMKLRVLGA